MLCGFGVETSSVGCFVDGDDDMKSSSLSSLYSFIKIQSSSEDEGVDGKRS